MLTTPNQEPREESTTTDETDLPARCVMSGHDDPVPLATHRSEHSRACGHDYLSARICRSCLERALALGGALRSSICRRCGDRSFVELLDVTALPHWN
ncbi:hypothetical protein [Kineococcus sp. SYSU DK001]|uniref:hypothetical protein n=1 Tax=Kineococcus sp. SYSU DK001 TaxID=3383122 RepID=UPI003D7F0450